MCDTRLGSPVPNDTYQRRDLFRSRSPRPSECFAKREMFVLKRQFMTPFVPLRGPIAQEKALKDCLSLHQLVSHRHLLLLACHWPTTNLPANERIACETHTLTMRHFVWFRNWLEWSNCQKHFFLQSCFGECDPYHYVIFLPEIGHSKMKKGRGGRAGADKKKWPRVIGQ